MKRKENPTIPPPKLKSKQAQNLEKSSSETRKNVAFRKVFPRCSAGGSGPTKTGGFALPIAPFLRDKKVWTTRNRRKKKV